MAAVGRSYWCHQCSATVPVTSDPPVCSTCHGEFLEEVKEEYDPNFVPVRVEGAFPPLAELLGQLVQLRREGQSAAQTDEVSSGRPRLIEGIQLLLQQILGARNAGGAQRGLDNIIDILRQPQAQGNDIVLIHLSLPISLTMVYS